ncbi:MAG: antitoxin [Acidimicrobiia bacterium]|nr:antitoxin [Acidimicrobiia bacterium]
MRTTVTLEPDTEQLLRQRMRERRISFKQALNEAIRDGLTRRGGSSPFRTQTASLGSAAVNLDRALSVAGDLEDDELTRKLRSGS